MWLNLEQFIYYIVNYTGKDGSIISVSEQLNTYPYTLTQHHSTDNKLALMLGLGRGRLYSYFDTEIYPKQAGTLVFENHIMILLGLKIHLSHILSVYW